MIIYRSLKLWLSINFVLAFDHDQTQLERYLEKGLKKTYQIEVPGKEPITIIQAEEKEPPPRQWVDISLDPLEHKDAIEMKDRNQDRYTDVTIDHSRCFGPSCRDNYEDGAEISPPDHLEDFLLEYADKMHFNGDAKDRLHAISSLASKLKDQSKADRYDTSDTEDNEDKSYPSSWNRLKVKKHKHPFDDRDGWVTMEAVPWSTSKVSKWKPNTNNYRPNHWEDDPYDDRFSNSGSEDQHKKPSNKRPTIIKNKPHYNTDWESEMPSKPSWAQQSLSYPSTWSPDEGRRPHKPNCDSDSHRYPSSEPEVYYGMSDSVVTDSRPSNFPYEYQALNRPFHRPTQVVYAGFPEEDVRSPSSHPSSGDGQWVLLSTTKGYHHSKKRPRSMSMDPDLPTMTAHRSVALTVLPLDGSKANMTTSHGGILEVERSFKSVDESKQDMDRKDIMTTGTVAPQRASMMKKLVKRRLVSAAPTADSSSVLAAVGAGMLPATMAMVVPMMLGKRRRRRDVVRTTKFTHMLTGYE